VTARQERASRNAEDWIKIDLHIHTLDDTKDALDYSAHQLLERAKALGLGVLAITLHDSVFDRAEVFADAASMGILLISAAEMRLHGADIVLLNVRPEEAAGLKDFDDVRRLRAARGASLFTFAPHPFYVMGGSIAAKFGRPLLATSDAHQLRAFGFHYTSIPRPAVGTPETVFEALRAGGARLTSPPCSFADLLSTLFFLFVLHPLRQWIRKEDRPERRS
jgi:hypothetical protein